MCELVEIIVMNNSGGCSADCKLRTDTGSTACSSDGGSLPSRMGHSAGRLVSQGRPFHHNSLLISSFGKVPLD